jgi:hypothetical protein
MSLRNPEFTDELMDRAMRMADYAFQRMGLEMETQFSTRRVDPMAVERLENPRERIDAHAWDCLWAAANCLKRRSERSDNLRVALRCWGLFREYSGKIGFLPGHMGDAASSVQDALEQLIGEG